MYCCEAYTWYLVRRSVIYLGLDWIIYDTAVAGLLVMRTSAQHVIEVPRGKEWGGSIPAADADGDGGDKRRRGLCHCAHCGPWLQDEYRDLSIRYPGMTKESFDEMMNLLDEVMMDGSADQIDIDDGMVYLPVEDFQQVEPALVPSSPPGAIIQPLLLSSPSEIQFGSNVGPISNSINIACGGIRGQGPPCAV